MTRRHDPRDGTRKTPAPDAAALDALARWLAAEEGAADAAAQSEAVRAEEALGALFTAALPRPEVPPALSARLAAVADEAAQRRSRALATVFGLPRRLLERLAAVLLLLVGLTGAVIQTVYQEAGGAALSRLSPGRVFSAAAEGLFTVVQVLVDAVETAHGLVDTGLRLSGAAATVAGTLPVTIALGAGLLLAAAAFFLLRDLLADERGWTYVDLE